MSEFPNFSNQPQKQPADTVRDLKAIFNQQLKNLMADFYCCLPGTIESFDSASQTCTVSINFKRVFTNLPDQTFMDYPPLVDCPVIVLTGGPGALTFPIAAGDTCLIYFSDRDIDTWLTTGQVTTPPSQRMHSLADGFVIVGVRTAINALEGYLTTGVQLKHGDNSVLTLIDEDGVELKHNESVLSLIDEVKAELSLAGTSIVSVEDKIKIEVSGVTLKTALDALCNALTSWVDTSGDTPNPATIAALVAAKALIDGVLK